MTETMIPSEEQVKNTQSALDMINSFPPDMRNPFYVAMLAYANGVEIGMMCVSKKQETVDGENKKKLQNI